MLQMLLTWLDTGENSDLYRVYNLKLPHWKLTRKYRLVFSYLQVYRTYVQLDGVMQKGTNPQILTF
jgi:hypothetical protein